LNHNKKFFSVSNMGRLFAVILAALICSGAFTVTAHAQASDVYITPDGGGNGICSNNTHPPSWFNSSGNWGSGSTQIGPGTVVHLCGTFNSPNGSTVLATRGSGSAGHPITILFESGANLSSPAWTGKDNGGGALITGGQSYIVVDGGTNGTIQNTNAGTNLSRPGSFQSLAVNAGTNNVTGCTPGCRITNLTVANMYVHVFFNNPSQEDCSVDQTNTNAVTIDGAVGIRIDHNTFHDMGWAISYIAAGLEMDHNNIYNIDHAIAAGATADATGVSIHDNHIHDFANWDTGFTNANCYHHDGIHFFSNPNPIINALVYNNLFDGDAGVNKNAYIYTEGDNRGTTIFNNVFTEAPSAQNGIQPIWLNGTNARIFNNTIYSSRPGVAGIQFFTGAGIILENNAIAGPNTLFYLANGSASSITTADYNLYTQGAGGNTAWHVGSISTNFLSSWQSSSGQDAHSQQPANAFINADGTPKTGFPGVGHGANLRGLGIAALNFDKNGNARSSSGAWDVGAFNSGATTAATPPAPTNLKAVVQ
jgi:hypothetical protein